MHRRMLMQACMLGWLMGLASCSEGPVVPADESTDPPPAAKIIYDGAHQGREGFYFLPPMVPEPTFQGVFASTLSPRVEVCLLNTADESCASVVRTFEVAPPDGSEGVRVDAEGEFYIANWHTDGLLAAGSIYRIRVLNGDDELGYADVEVGATGADLKNIDTKEYVPLKDGRTLPIKFRIEDGALRAPGPDLVWLECSAPAEVLITERVDFAVVLANVGDEDAHFPAGYSFGWRMWDGGSTGGVTSSDVTLAPGEERSIPFYWQPLSHSLGTYTPYLEVDPGDRVAESDEDNNTLSCGTITVVEPSELPDLVITSVETTVTPVNTASDFKWVITVENQGTADAFIPYSYNYNNRIIGSSYSYYVYVPGSSGWTLPAGASATFEVNPNLPYLPVGTYNVSFTVDPGNKAYESDESNNTYTRSFTMEEAGPATGPAPDLVWRECSAPAEVLLTERVDFTVVLANDGEVTATFPAGYSFGWRMWDGGSTGGGTSSGVTLAPGETRAVTFYWQPLSHSVGTYSPWVEVDPDNRIQETNEDNNTLSCGTITVVEPSELPDLVITSVETTVTPVTDATDFKWLITVENQGTADAFIPYSYNFNNKIIDSSYSYYVYVPGSAGWTLAPGASQTFEVNPNWPYLPVGTYDVSFRVDPGNKAYESDETNNSFVRSFTVLDSGS